MLMNKCKKYQYHSFYDVDVIILKNSLPAVHDADTPIIISYCLNIITVMKSVLEES